MDPITGKKEYRAWLQYAGDRLMKLGIEPVAIPALTSGKNTVDMRIAMDAGCCAVSPAPAKRVILVAGDVDYVPVILQLRSLGVEVLVVGFRPDSDQSPIWKYVRNFASEFCCFEDLLEEHTARISETVKEEQEKNVPHSVFYYETVLEGSEPRFVLVPREDWIAITNAIYRAINRGVTTLDDLETRVLQELGADPMDASGSLTAVMNQLWDSRCFRLLENGSQLPDRRDRQIGFALEIDDPEKMRFRARLKIVRTLQQRLHALKDLRPMQPKVIAEMLFGSELSPSDTQNAEQLIRSATNGEEEAQISLS